MTIAWITTSSIHVEAMLNSIIAACEREFVPTDLYLIETPGASEHVDRALDVAASAIAAYDGDDPEIHLTTLEHETEFDRIRAHIKEAIETVHESDGEVAVDITPGRKFMSAIAFAAGFRYGADHVFYFYHESSDYYGHVYPEMPRTACKLYDFTEVL